MMTAVPLQNHAFDDLIIEFQPRLLAFIYSLCKDKNQAQDVLQNTNVILWSKRDQYEMGSNFKAWAFQIAYFEVKQAKRKVYNSKETSLLDSELMESLQTEANRQDEHYHIKRNKLKECLTKLDYEQKVLIIDRYYGNESVQIMANQRGVSPNTMAKQLYRIRKALMQCIEKQIQEPDFNKIELSVQ